MVKIRVEHGEYEESEIILRCRELDDEMLEILAILRERSSKLVGYRDGEAHMLAPTSIFYVDAVDGRTFLYTADAVYETHHSLTTLQSHHAEAGFHRIGKSQIVNLLHVAKLKSQLNSRVEVSLHNGEKLIVSRHYVPSLKEKLGMLD